MSSDDQPDNRQPVAHDYIKDFNQLPGNLKAAFKHQIDEHYMGDPAGLEAYQRHAIKQLMQSPDLEAVKQKALHQHAAHARHDGHHLDGHAASHPDSSHKHQTPQEHAEEVRRLQKETQERKAAAQKAEHNSDHRTHTPVNHRATRNIFAMLTGRGKADGHTASTNNSHSHPMAAHHEVAAHSSDAHQHGAHASGKPLDAGMEAMRQAALGGGDYNAMSAAIAHARSGELAQNITGGQHVPRENATGNNAVAPKATAAQGPQAGGMTHP